MCNFFRIAIFAIAIVMMNVEANAQEQGEKAFGAHLTFGSGDDYSNTGLGAKFRYNVSDPLRLEGSFTFFLKKDYMSMWDLSANLQYLIHAGDQAVVYPLIGLSMMGLKVEAFGLSASDNDLGLNVGGGFDFKLNDKTVLNAELKYRLGLGDIELNRLGISLGVAFSF